MSNKVLHIINSVSGGGAERLVNLWATKRNIDVLSLMPLPEKFKKNSNYFSLDSKRVYNPFCVFSLYKYIKKYDVIHVHLFPVQFYVALYSYLFPKKKFITTEHNSYNRRRDKALFKIIDRWMYKRFSLIGCVSEATKQNLDNYIKNVKQKYNTKTIENGLDIDLIKKAKPYSKSDLSYNDDIVLIGMFSRFSDQKDHFLLIESLSKLRSDKYRLILAGDGELREKTEQYVKKMNLDDKITFLGYRDDAYSLMKACDIIVQSSHWEGLCLVVVEAVLSGCLYVFVKNVDGLNHLLPKNYQFNNAIELTSLIENRFSIPEILSDNFSKYSIDKMISNYEDYYSK